MYDRPLADHELDAFQADSLQDAPVWSVWRDVRPVEVHETGPVPFTWDDLFELLWMVPVAGIGVFGLVWGIVVLLGAVA